MRPVLVSGVGAVIGYGIVRSLKQRRPQIHVIGTDIHDHAVGQAWCDVFIKCPPVIAEHFPSFLLELIRDHEIGCVFSGFPQEIPFLASLQAELEDDNARVVLNSASSLALGTDKWELAKAVHLEPLAIETRLVTSQVCFDDLAGALGCPFVVKPRAGSASRGLAIISGKDDWRHVIRDGSLIAQTIIGTADDEYTAAIHGDGEGAFTASIVMRRWLGREGNTVRAEVVASAPFLDAFRSVCELARPIGPTNLQFRLDRGIPYLLEINPRISSSTYMRSLCGYNEALMAYDHYVNGALPEQPVVQPRRLIRYCEDRVW
ncbi:MAG: ATP-grasp domain-containing protein [Hyphomicrobiales bacterium]|nr:ATP-grasp domain-containing protein [Hyphomicrobiales bacterium]